MTKFIRVTEIHTNGSIVDMLVNTANIMSIKLSDKRTDTHISLRDGKYLFVKESTEAIWNMLNDPVMTDTEPFKYLKMNGG